MEEDPVVAEIPVLHSKALERLLHVFCFPLRTSDRPYDATRVSLSVTETQQLSGPRATPQEVMRVAGTQNAQRGGMKSGNDRSSVAIGQQPRFSMFCELDVGPQSQASFSGIDPVQNILNSSSSSSSATGGSSNVMSKDAAAIVSSSSRKHLFTNQGGAGRTGASSSSTSDDPFSENFGENQNQNHQNYSRQNNNNNNNNNHQYRLDSVPTCPHSSYAAALFHGGCLHLTSISQVHQFYPRSVVDQLLDLDISSLEGGGSSNADFSPMIGGGGGSGGGNQNQPTSTTIGSSQYVRPLPRSVAFAKSQLRSKKLDYFNPTDIDCQTIAMRLVCDAAGGVGSGVPSDETTTTDVSSSSSSVDAVKGSVSSSSTTTIPLHHRMSAPELYSTAAMIRSSSDPSRDEDEMMWGLQSFFPFIDSTISSDVMSAASSLEARRRAAEGKGGTAAGTVSLKFAHHAMSIDEQVGTVLSASKLATCEDLQRVVQTPDQHQQYVSSYSSNSTEREGSEGSNSKNNTPRKKNNKSSSFSNLGVVVGITRLVQTLRRVSVCIHGCWAALYDNNCSGSAAFMREYIMYCFAVEPSARLTARQIMQPFENSTRMRQIARNVLPLFAILDRTTTPPSWVLKHYENGKHEQELQKQCAEEVQQQLSNWHQRKNMVVQNISLLAAGELVSLRNLALKSVAAAAYQAMKGTGSVSGGSSAAAAGTSSPSSSSSSSSNINNRNQMIISEDLARCRRFIRNSYELHGVINKALFRERILAMQRTPESIIYQVPKERLQEALKEELMPFTDTTWVLKNPSDVTTSQLRPYFIQAMLDKLTFTTKEITNLALQLVIADPNQSFFPVPSSFSTSATTTAVVKQEVQDEDSAAAATTSPTTTSPTVVPPVPSSNQQQQQHIPVTREIHDVAVRIINEFAQFHRGEKAWHVKTGIVAFLAIS